MDRSHVVKIGNDYSHNVRDESGVPQDSVMGPILFTLYSAPIYDIVKAHGLKCMINTDDLQVHLSFPSSSSNIAVCRIDTYIKDIILWSTIKNMLLFNGNKDWGDTFYG